MWKRLLFSGAIATVPLIRCNLYMIVGFGDIKAALLIRCDHDSGVWCQSDYHIYARILVKPFLDPSTYYSWQCCCSCISQKSGPKKLHHHKASLDWLSSGVNRLSRSSLAYVYLASKFCFASDVCAKTNLILNALCSNAENGAWIGNIVSVHSSHTYCR